MVVATEKFVEHSPNQTPLSAFHGTRIHLPSNEAIWPSKVHLAWHRKMKYDRVNGWAEITNEDKMCLSLRH